MPAPDLLTESSRSLPSLGGPARHARAWAARTREGADAQAPAFARALQDVQSAQSATASQPGTSAQTRTVASGDTLSGIVQEQAAAMGLRVDAAQAYRLAQQLARVNRIDNPDRIFVGQQLDMRALSQQIAQSGAAEPAAAADAGATIRPRYMAPPAAAQSLAAPPARAQPVQSQQAAVAVAPPAATPRFARVAINQALAPNGKPMPVAANPSAAATAHPVLQKTLDRAVAKGFIPAQERAAVYDKILGLAREHNFVPDDFARMTLMESDGMNPRASNDRCHGIIQFCDGPARGAATAGYAKNPKAILNLSVYAQLDLVDKYFDEVGLKNKGPAGLEDLYLSVLNPASRAQSSATTPLNIPGVQARDLHVGGDTDNPITRQSIRFGLLQNAAARLREMVPSRLRSAAQGAVAYAENQAN